MQKENKMGVIPVPRRVLSMAVPIMISMLVQSMYNIVDGIFVARISEDALTATSLAYSAQILQIAVAVGTGVGMNALVSRKLDAKRFAEANEAAATGLLPASVTMMIGYAVSGLGNGMVNLISTALRQCIVLIPLVYLFGRLGGIRMIWFAFWVAELCAAAYAIVQLRRRMKTVQKELAV